MYWKVKFKAVSSWENDGSWHYVHSTVDTNNNEVTAMDILLFSIFAILREDPTTPQLVKIDSPENRIYGTPTITIRAMVVDRSVDTVIAEINSTENITLAPKGNDYYSAQYTFSEGLNTVRIYANDTDGNMNSNEIVTFTIVTTHHR